MKHWERGKFGIILLGFQIAFIILFGFFAEYAEDADAKNPEHSKGDGVTEHNTGRVLYPMFQDIHVMIFIGFGFLMTFLRRYGFSSVGLNFLLGAFTIQWHLLFRGWLHMHGPRFHIDVGHLITADFSAATILITFGALLGKTSPLQMVVLAFIEVAVSSVNEYIGIDIYRVADIGGSMFLHTFGAYYGLAVARVLYNEDIAKSVKNGSRYHSDVFAMIGTIYLWMYWPSFNAALAPGDDNHRAVINTYISLAMCCVTAFAISSLVDKHNRLDMVHVQNSTIAGGVAIGTTADMMTGPWGAGLIGMVAATISVLGYKYLTPLLARKLKITDTCGINNLHGMPGILAALAGAVMASLSNTENMGNSVYLMFPARAPPENSTALADILRSGIQVSPGVGRSALAQGGYQMAALATTIGIAIFTGIITGFILKLPIWSEPKGDKLYDDAPFWEVPEDFIEEGQAEEFKNKTGKLLPAAEEAENRV